MTTTTENPRDPRQSDKQFVLAQVFGDPEWKTSGIGNEYMRLTLVTANGMGKGTDIFWNATVMKALVDRATAAGAGPLFAKRMYAKFSGKASHREYTKKDGTKAMSNDLLVDAIYLQDGTAIYGKDKKEGQDEDAPF